MTEYICNAAGKVAYCAKCLTAKPHECRPLNYFHCSEAGGSVRCDLIEETHTCYYCNHEGPCVNRIHSTEFTAWGKTQEIRYVCDDVDACDERWQALQEGNLEARVASIVLGEMLRAHGIPIIPSAGFAELAGLAAKRIMKLIGLPF